MIGEKCPRCGSINLRMVASGHYVPSSVCLYPSTRMEWFRVECGYCLFGTAQYETKGKADKAWLNMCMDESWQ